MNIHSIRTLEELREWHDLRLSARHTIAESWPPDLSGSTVITHALVAQLPKTAAALHFARQVARLQLSRECADLCDNLDTEEVRGAERDANLRRAVGHRIAARHQLSDPAGAKSWVSRFRVLLHDAELGLRLHRRTISENQGDLNSVAEAQSHKAFVRREVRRLCLARRAMRDLSRVQVMVAITVRD